MYSQQQFNGYGKYYYPSGDIYEGEFLNGKFQGYGKYTSVENGGAVMEGFFVDGKFSNHS